MLGIAWPVATSEARQLSGDEGGDAGGCPAVMVRKLSSSGQAVGPDSGPECFAPRLGNPGFELERDLGADDHGSVGW